MIVLDVKGSLAFIGIGFTILGLSTNERLMMRLWIIGHIVQCLFHMAQVIVEYKKQHRAHLVGLKVSTSWESTGDSNSNSKFGGHWDDYGIKRH